MRTDLGLRRGRRGVRRSRSGSCCSSRLNPFNRSSTSALSLHPALVFRDDPAMAHDQHAVACPQIFQFAADHQNRLAVLPHFFDGAEQSFLRIFTSIPAVGSIRTRTEGVLARARPMTTFCWLPPDRLGDQLLGPFGDDPQRVDRRVGRRSAAMRRDGSRAARAGAQWSWSYCRRPRG